MSGRGVFIQKRPWAYLCESIKGYNALAKVIVPDKSYKVHGSTASR